MLSVVPFSSRMVGEFCFIIYNYVDFDASSYIEWKEYPAVKAPVAAE